MLDVLLLAALASFLSTVLVALYVYFNDRRLRSIPSYVLALSPHRSTPHSVTALAAQLVQSPPISIHEQLPPGTGRRYIVVGGGGFVGGWIVSSLLDRGEHPMSIRILDIRPPIREDLKSGRAAHIQFIQVDISDPDAVHAAFLAPWPASVPDTPLPELTIFHTAANIRFYERHPAFLPLSEGVNVRGTAHVLDASRAAGASILIFTSSGSVAIRRSHFFLFPFHTVPRHFLQVITDDNARAPREHHEFFSNYAVTKLQAERLVRAADKSPCTDGTNRVLRTGAIRPGNGVFGPRGDMFCGAYLVRGTNPTWISNVLQSFCYVENCALAHLCYEQRLLDLQPSLSLLNNTKKSLPDIGGQAFVIADPGPAPTYGDVYTTLETLSQGECTFPNLSPTTMLILAHLIEAYCLSRHFLVSSSSPTPLARFAERFLPPINGDLINLQPPLFALTSVHLIFDDSRARLPPEKGGLGYTGAWTTLQGLHKTVEEHRNGVGQSGRRSSLAGVSLGFGMGKAQRAVGKAAQRAAEKLGVGPVPISSSKPEFT